MRPNGIIIGISGLWLIVAGFIGLGIQGNIWNDVIVGVIVAVAGFTMLAEVPVIGMVSGILGMWMIASAFIPALSSGTGGRSDDVVVGIILAIVGFSRSRTTTERITDVRRAA